MSETDVLKMKVADLKRELKLRGLTTTGNKTELQERLQNALLDGDLSLEDTAISAEDLLDEDVLTDEEEKAVLASPTDEKDLLQLPTPKDVPKSLDLTTGNENRQPKKIILKRKSSFSNLSINTSPIGTCKENTAPPAEKIAKVGERKTITTLNSDNETSENDKKVVKLSQLSLQERLEMRAKKFGASDSKPSNISSTTPITFSSSKDEEQQIEALKKRAERFKCVVAPKIADLEKAEKLQKRKERFGIVTSNPTDSPVSDKYAEKAKLRLERFKSAAATK